jgi:hypothetical protein
MHASSIVGNSIQLQSSSLAIGRKLTTADFSENSEDKGESLCGSRTGGWSLLDVMSD